MDYVPGEIININGGPAEVISDGKVLDVLMLDPSKVSEVVLKKLGIEIPE